MAPGHETGDEMTPLEITKINYDNVAKGVFSIWIVYNRPLDHPDGHIARRREVKKGINGPTVDAFVGDLKDIRKTFILAGLDCIARDPEDEPHVVESWL
jgi:hypothetical protein